LNSTAPMGRADSDTGPAAAVTPPWRFPRTSSTVPHARHSAHWPTHFEVDQPHSEHRYNRAALPMRDTVEAATDSRARPRPEQAQ